MHLQQAGTLLQREDLPLGLGRVMVTQGSLLLRVGGGMWQVLLVPEASRLVREDESAHRSSGVYVCTLKSWEQEPKRLLLRFAESRRAGTYALSGTREDVERLAQHLPPALQGEGKR